MNYDNVTTFNVKTQNAIAQVTFDYSPVNSLGLPMLADINMLAKNIEEETYWISQATSQTSALKRFRGADENGAQFDINNQRS